MKNSTDKLKSKETEFILAFSTLANAKKITDGNVLNQLTTHAEENMQNWGGENPRKKMITHFAIFCGDPLLSCKRVFSVIQKRL